MAEYYVYILASRPGGTVYVGVTNDLIRRVYEHKIGAIDGFTKEYGVKQLVYFESYPDVRDALQREKNMKHWPRVRRDCLPRAIPLGVICMKRSLVDQRCPAKRDGRS